MENKKKAFNLIETWEDTNIELGLQLIKGNKELKKLATERYKPIYEAFGKKTIAGLKKLTSKWNKLKNMQKLSALMYWPKDVKFLPIDSIDLAANYRVNSWRESFVSNQISDTNLKVSGDLKVLKNIKTLNIEHNQFKTLPKNLANLSSLTHLYADDNELTELPDFICEMTSLEYIDIGQSYDIKKLPENIGNLSNLKILILAYCNVEELPTSFYNLTQLVALNLHSNPIGKNIQAVQKIMKALPNCKVSCNAANTIIAQQKIKPIDTEGITELNLKGKGLFEFPPELLAATDIEVLNLENNDFRELPAEIGRYKKLKKINIKGNRYLESLPDQFCELESLEELNIMDCRIKQLPEKFGQLKNLRKFFADGLGGLQDLPDSFNQLSNLEEFYCKNGDFKKIPEDMSALTAFKILKISYNTFYQQKAWTTLPALEQLKVEDSRRIKNAKELALSENFSKLLTLKKLSITSCDYNALFDGIENLVNLEELELSRCSSLLSLPIELYQLLKLQKLIVFVSQVSELNEAIGNLKELKHLTLRSNQLTTIPDTIGELTQLEHLNIQTNRLKILPDSIVNLKNLKNLYLFDNPLTKNKSYIKKLRKEMKWCKVHVKETYSL